MDLHWMSLGELGREIRAGHASPVDVVDVFLERIDRLDPRLGAFVRVDAEQARAAAKARTAELVAGHDRGPLHGLPIALKDLIDIEGTITTAGSLGNRGRRSMLTATLVQRLEAAGMVVLGKLHTVEYAFGGWGVNPEMGTPRNPWDRDCHRVPGGSSSGSGVAVAAGLVPCAIGTDTGGSVRLPAAFCGITGLKTTKGLVSCHGIVPLAPSLDTPGPLARSARDAALLLEAMAGPDPLDPGSVAPPAASLKPANRPITIGRLDHEAEPGISPAIWANYEAGLHILETKGARIRPVQLPRGLLDYVALSTVLEAEAYASHGAKAEDEAAELGPAVRARILKGRVPARDYLEALWRMPEERRRFLEALDGIDALIAPTTMTTAIPVAAVDDGSTPALLTRFVNLLGLCALAVPTGFDELGLPTSMQIVGRPFGDATVLAIGDLFQTGSDWHTRHPSHL